MAKADVKDIQRLVKSTGFYRAKAKNIKSLSSKIVTDYDGKVPNKLESLITFPGVVQAEISKVVIKRIESLFI